MPTTLTRSERETLKSIYRLTAGHGAAPDAHTGVLAEAMGVSPATVTATVKRLADRGLAHHRPYRGVELTADGRQAALGAIRRHRIVERSSPTCWATRGTRPTGSRPASSTSCRRRSRTGCTWPSTAR